MHVVLSGQAGTFAVRRGAEFAVHRLETGAAGVIAAHLLRYLFEGCTDVATLEASSLQEAQSRTEMAWACDRTLRLLLLLIDPDTPASERSELADALEALLAAENCQIFVQAQMYGAPLPEDVRLPASEYLQPYPRLAKLVADLTEDQEVIGEVSRGLAAIEGLDDAGTTNLNVFREAAISRGVLLDVVKAVKSASMSDALVFSLHERMADVPHHRSMLSSWIAKYRPKPKSMPVQREEDPTEAAQHYKRPPPHTTYDNVMRQQDAIVAKLEEGDLSAARKFAAELVAHQLAGNDRDFAAKTMTKLSQIAKSLEYFDLQLEWALGASSINPDDARTHAQVIDAYIQLGRYNEAYALLDLAEAGDAARYTLTVRARILRAQRDYERALEAYRLVKETYPDDPNAVFAWSGVAECLRDLGRSNEALQVYNDAIKRYPHEVVLRRARAATLAEVGLISDAAAEYADVLLINPNDTVALNGKASLLKLIGHLDEAERLYRRLVDCFPRASYSYLGLADCLRLNGKLPEAVEWGRKALRSFPDNWVAYSSYSHALLDTGEVFEAEAVCETAFRLFPEEPRVVNAWAYVQRRRGNYSEAIRIYDDLDARYPADGYTSRARADMLRHLGRVEEALVAYDSIMDIAQHRTHAKTAKASLLTDLGRFEEASHLFSEATPKTQEDWRNFVVKGMWLLRQARPDEASEHLNKGVNHCPFTREKRFIQSALTSIGILHPSPDAAILPIVPAPPDVTGLITFHALAMANQAKKAAQAYRRLKDGLPHQYHGLRDEIAKRYRVIPGRSRKRGSWLALQAARSLLLEAA